MLHLNQPLKERLYLSVNPWSPLFPSGTGGARPRFRRGRCRLSKTRWPQSCSRSLGFSLQVRVPHRSERRKQFGVSKSGPSGLILPCNVFILVRFPTSRSFFSSSIQNLAYIQLIFWMHEQREYLHASSRPVELTHPKCRLRDVT